MTATSRSERYRAARAAAQAAQPTRCPACGDDGEVAPTFAADDIWDCGACGNVWEVRHGEG